MDRIQLKWVWDKEGGLVQLDQIARLYLARYPEDNTHAPESMHVMALLPDGSTICLENCETKDEAKKFLQSLVDIHEGVKIVNPQAVIPAPE